MKLTKSKLKQLIKEESRKVLREQDSPCGKKPLWPGDAKASRKVDPSGAVLKDQRAWYKCKNKGTKLPAGYPFSPKNSAGAAAGYKRLGSGPAGQTAAPAQSSTRDPWYPGPKKHKVGGAPIEKLEMQLVDITVALQAMLKAGKIDAETVNQRRTPERFK